MLRRYAVPISIVVHAAALALIVATPFLAGDALPNPVTRIVFAAPAPLQVREPPPPIRPAAPAEARQPNPSAAPTDAPSTIAKEPADLPAPTLPIGGMDGGLPGGTGAGVKLADPPPAPEAMAAPAPVRVGGQIKAPRQIRQVNPVYPQVALAARVSGAVVLDAVIGEDGRVRDVTIRSSVPLLDKAAVDAVRQWAFTPTTLNGVAVPVILTVTVNFALRRP